nr:type II toxin-antitoxin system HicB family antitoxin [Microcystis sp. MC19]
MITYLATVHKDNHSDYGVQFYDFPGCKLKRT